MFEEVDYKIINDTYETMRKINNNAVRERERETEGELYGKWV